MTTSKINLVIDNYRHNGVLSFPEFKSTGLVIFVHGSASSGYSPRIRFLSKIFNDFGIASLLIDLLTFKETQVDNQTKEYRFNIELQAKRLLEITDVLSQDDRTCSHGLGYFGSSTGTAVAIAAAAKRFNKTITIVSRSGRPDLVQKNYFEDFKSSILLIIGSKDNTILKINKDFYNQLRPDHDKKIIVIPGATHLFEETGKLEQVSRISAKWFKDKFPE